MEALGFFVRIISLFDESLVDGDQGFLLRDDGLGLDGELSRLNFGGALSEEGAHEASPLGLRIVVVIEHPFTGSLVIVAVVSDRLLAPLVINLIVDVFYYEGVLGVSVRIGVDGFDGGACASLDLADAF